MKNVKVNREVIQKYMEDNNLTRDELAKKCNIGKSTLFRVMNYDGYYSIKTFNKISIYTGIKIQDLIEES